MERFGYIKIGLASILVIMLLALGGLTATVGSPAGALTSLVSTASTIAQKIEANQAVYPGRSEKYIFSARISKFFYRIFGGF